MSDYREIFQASLDDPAAFWAQAATAVSWTKEPQRILDDDHPPFYRWFPDAELNTCANALDRHIETRGDQAALIYDSPVTGTKKSYTYHELLHSTACFAGVLRSLGVGKGDRVVLYLPMIPQAVIAMLACARIGAVHSVVFGGFASHELAARIDDARPEVIVTASCGIEPTRVIEYTPMLDHALTRVSHQPRACVVVQRDRLRCDLVAGRDHDWDEVMASAEPVDPVPVAATDPLYVRYTSGTTGKPKGIVRDNGGHAVALALACATSTTSVRAKCTGPLRMSAGWWATLTSCTGRCDDGSLRGQADRYPGPGGVLAAGVRVRGEGAVLRADRASGDPQGGPGRLIHQPLRPVVAEVPVPGRRTAGPRHLRVGIEGS